MAKTVNYTNEQVFNLVNAYSAANTVDERNTVVASFAKEFDKSIASIRAKLSREGVYIKKEYAKKDGSASIRKSQKVAYIAAACGKTAEQMGSLEKATNNVLDWIIETIKIQQDS